MQKIITIVLLLISQLHGTAQISGKVFDSETKEPIAFANIGLLGKSIGTVSDVQGNFSLPISESNNKDTLVISMLGFERIMMTVEQYLSSYPKDKATIALIPKTFIKSDVVVRPRKFISKTLGNSNTGKSMSLGFMSNDLGSELGVRMKVKKNHNCFIDTLFFNINSCTYDSVVFRVNIYSLEKGKPQNSLLDTPLYVICKIQNGTLKVDVSHLNLQTDEDFFVSLEWLRDLGEGTLNFNAGFTNTHSMARKASQGSWNSLPAGVGFYSAVRLEKKTKE